MLDFTEDYFQTKSIFYYQKLTEDDDTLVCHFSIFDKKDDIVYCMHRWQGFYSCSTETVSIIIYLLNRGYIPKIIDYSRAAWLYKIDPYSDIFNDIFKIDDNLNIEINQNIKEPPYEGKWWCNTCRDHFDKNLIEHSQKIVRKYFNASEVVSEYKQKIVEKYQINFEKTLGVYYRGTDKTCELEVMASVDQYINFCRNFLEKNQDFRILIQSDENRVIESFKETFGERCFSIEESCFKDEQYETVPEDSRGKGIHFRLHHMKDIHPTTTIQWFDAAVRCISECKNVLTYTGNISLFMKFYRDSLDGFYQFDEYGDIKTFDDYNNI